MNNAGLRAKTRAEALPANAASCAAPERLNWILLVAAAAATSGCLWLACHGTWWVALLAAIAFAFVNNVPFALMHEAVHGVAANTPRRNYAFGFIASCMFPTSFTMQRVAHIGHHERNRTDADLYDYYLPSQSRLVRNLWLYSGNLLGLYWFLIPLSNLVYLFGTPLYRSRVFVERIAPKLGFGPHVRDIAQLSPGRVWLEMACAFGYQAALYWSLGLNWKGWLLAHWLFAMHWSALQYVDHAWSTRRQIWRLGLEGISSRAMADAQLSVPPRAPQSPRGAVDRAAAACRPRRPPADIPADLLEPLAPRCATGAADGGAGRARTICAGRAGSLRARPGESRPRRQSRHT